MTRFHVNNAGEASRCKAEKGGCPFGSAEEHHETADGARQAYEERMSGREIPAVQKSDGDPNAGYLQRDLRELASNSKDGAVLEMAVQRGDEGVLRAVADNPNANSHHLWKVEDRAKNAKTKQHAKNNPNYVPREFTPENVKRFARDPKQEMKLAPMIHGQGSDRFVRYVGQSAPDGSALHREIVASPNPKISLETRLTSMKTDANKAFRKTQVRTEGFPGKELYPHMTHDQRKSYAHHTEDPEALSAMSQSAVDMVESPKRPNDFIDGRDLAKTLYENPNISKDDVELLKRANPSIASVERVRAIERDNPGDYGRIIVEEDYTPGSPKKQTFTLDTELMDRIGLQDDDVYQYMGSRGHYLFRTSWDRETGTFTGFPD